MTFPIDDYLNISKWQSAFSRDPSAESFCRVSARASVQCFVFSEVDSTMECAKRWVQGGGVLPADLAFVFDAFEQAPNCPLRACFCASQQSDGRGRLGRRWESNSGKGVYLTLLYEKGQNMTIDGLSLAAGIGAVRLVESLGIKCALKWPNDILWSNEVSGQYSKLGGVLVQIFAENETRWISVGLGLNVNTSQEVQSVGGISLGDITNKNYPIADVTSAVAGSVHLAVSDCLVNGFASCKAEWLNRSALKGSYVEVMCGKQKVCGKVVGVSDAGGLQVCSHDTADGLREIFCGEVTSFYVARN